MISSIIFIILSICGFGFFAWNALKIRQNILLGRDLDRTDKKSQRWKIMTLVALGQKKMFARPIPALLHFALYAALAVATALS